MVKDIIFRIIAAFVATALGVIGTGSVVGVSIWQAALMAGVGAVAGVVERLARAFMDDGRLTIDEVNAAFNIQPKEDAVAEKPVTVAGEVLADAPAVEPYQ
jgi:hypothetical protein